MSDFQVGGGVDGTWPRGVQLRVGHRKGASSLRRTAGVDDRQHVGTAADITEIALDAVSQLHSAVAGAPDEDDMMSAVAGDVHRLHVAELVYNQRSRPCVCTAKARFATS